jgi:hypothetical protein
MAASIGMPLDMIRLTLLAGMRATACLDGPTRQSAWIPFTDGRNIPLLKQFAAVVPSKGKA